MWRAHRISRKASLGRLLLKTSRRNPCSHNSSHLANASSQTNSSNINNVLASHFSTRTHVITGDCKNQDHALETGEEELFRRERKLQHPGASGADGFRHLFNTLGIISAGVPRQLVDVTSKTTVAENHWRNADVFKGYRDGSFHNWKSSNNQKTSSVAAAAISLSDPDEEDQDYDLDEQETISFQQQRKRHQVDSSWEKGEDLLGDIQIGEDCDEEYSDQASKAAATVESQDLSLSDEEFDERSIMTAVEQQLSETIRKRHVDDAIQLFEIGTVQHGLEISMDIVDDLYRLMTYHRPFHSYQLLQYILRRTNTDIQASSRYDDKEDEKSIEESQRIGKLYRRMCFSLRLLDPIKSRHGDIRSLVSSVVSDLREMNEHVERLCLPVLVTSLAEQRSSNIGRWAFRYYQRMAEKNYELRPEYFQHLLTLSKFNRQDNLPYHDILQQVVQAGRRPLPHIVMNALENMFPYTDNVQGTYIALQSVMELQRQSQQMAQEQQQQRELDVAQLAQEQDPEEIEKIKKRMSLYRKPRSYVVDIATLESMNVAAARTGCAELALLLWDALDIMGYEPTESIYESTIVCFAKDDNLCENAFVVLKEMEDKGFVPSRALIKSFSMALRDNFARLEFANNMLQSFLTGAPDAVPFTPKALNVLMAAYAERGNVDITLNLLEEFYKNEMAPDVDSFTFALEAVGKATARMVKNEKLRMAPEKKARAIESYLSVADSILSRMEEPQGPEGKTIVPTNHLIRNYVEFLCLVKQVGTATDVVVDALEREAESEDAPNIVDNKIILRVAIANAEEGNFDMARRLAASVSEPLPFMDAKIDKIEESLLSRTPQRQDGSLEDSQFATRGPL